MGFNSVFKGLNDVEKQSETPPQLDNWSPSSHN